MLLVGRVCTRGWVACVYRLGVVRRHATCMASLIYGLSVWWVAGAMGEFMGFATIVKD